MINTSYINKVNVSDNFLLSEYACPCCQMVRVDSRLVAANRLLRAYLESAYTFLSAFRCLQHNTDVGGCYNSYHLYGMAIDLSAGTIGVGFSVERLKNWGFNGIIYYPKKHFWHLDVRPGLGYVNLGGIYL